MSFCGFAQIVKHFFSSQLEISHVLNGQLPKFNTENEDLSHLDRDKIQSSQFEIYNSLKYRASGTIN
jgi:hypothetical protein